MANVNTTQTPAKIAMAKRTRVSFGRAYIRAVLEGTQRDIQKQIAHGVALQLGTPKSLRRIKPEKLIDMLGNKLKELGENAPKNAPFVH